MSRINIAPLAAALLGIAVLAAPTTTLWAQPASAEAVASIEAQARRFSEAYVRGDVEAMMSIYAADGVAAPGGRDFIRGRETLTRYWTLPEGRTIVRHVSTPVEIRVEGDTAYDWGYYEGQAAQDGNPLEPFRGKYVIIWERGDDGVWRMAMDMWNAMPEAE